MARPVAALTLLLCLSGCGTFLGTVPNVPSRDTVGVAVAEPKGSANTAPASAGRTLDYEVSQICTRGAMPLRQDVEPAEGDRVLVDRLLQCKPYELTILGYDFAGLVLY